jgi:CheY-like chemotaxis protein
MTRILVLDDDEILLRLLSIILRSSDYEVETAPEGRTGLEALQEHKPDLIILDLSMPGMDGRTFYRAARLKGYEGPVLLCSASNVEAAKRELGADAALGKPFDPDDLLSVVDELVATR